MRTPILTLLLSLTLLLASAAPAAAAENQWPQDARDVAFAIASRATGQPGLANIGFAPGAENGIEGVANNFYSAFQAGRIALVTYTNFGTGSVYDAEVAGVINLADPNGRIVALQFGAKYSVNGTRITINQVATATASPPTVFVEVYMVPMDTFMNVPYDVVNDWGALYKVARENAYLPPKEEAPKGAYMVLTFVKNRIAPDSQFEAIVNTRKTARTERDNTAKEKERIMDYQGWRVHMFAARFSPTSIRDHFYINYYYTPGMGVPASERERVQVARWDSKPSGDRQAAAPKPAPMVVEEAPAPTFNAPPPPAPAYAPQPAPKPAPAPAYAPQPAPQPAPQAAPEPHPVYNYAEPTAQPPASPPAPAAAGPGPLERGLAFLNPVFPDDVELIQNRLKELGIYKGTIDKTFGPMTKRSLDHFAVQHGFPKGQWSLGLQKALFQGTGL
ncbi:MAG: peptidoglycan-binding protein [Pseudodesulfovibrio sp.]|jgi:hypothetical protein|uniref:Peptidoglycan binding protein n=1 Tax=Pseudodesulfovibrio indicus TaxID=1716143 RepID=A0A140D929_9BACT|nr:peptidoglycan-binding domain-containing protein [Pseudodesulfovibrio indicus]AMK09696.1 hypothetical protein AWY79_00525 [Pseudodesulfovibrio indicus]TDT86348.1 putative peptidoglycan binding protein [Pseudodesulfovibrio indicus]